MGLAHGAHPRPDHRAPVEAKKNLSGALLQIARTGWVSDPFIADVFRARRINNLLGGAFVTPWDLDKMDEATLDIFDGLVIELPGYRKGQQEIDKKFSEWRAQHPTYRH